jgi:peptidoglycan-associated lipoprotein
MNWKHLLIATATASLLAACASTKPQTVSAPSPVTLPAATLVAPVSSGTSQSTSIDPLSDPSSPLAQRSVYFDFDSSAVKDQYRPTVAAHADFLKANSNHKVVIQGNTDARGSREYNLALGQRRAESVKQAMEVLGVPEQQLEAVSFGMEKPRVQGSTDADFAANRRDDIVYDNK